ncbi:MAG: hypothetical protein SPD95_06090 [Candidatus Faecousia sp.]|nr:hypothetical protein [Candidatus Faecousia sp.]
MKTLKKALAFTLALTLLFTLAACGGSAAPAATQAAAPAETQAPVAAAIDKAAFDALIASGIVADDADIEANAWAAAVKKAGVLRVGGTRTSFLFSQLDETDNSLRGFDAGLYQLLARYILGDRTGIDTAPAAPAVG